MKCVICSSGDTVKSLGKIGGYQENTIYEIFNCKNCDTSFIDSESISDDVLKKVYNSIYRQIDKIPGYVRYSNYSKRVMHYEKPLDYLASEDSMYWAVKQYFVNKNISPNAKILEVGCGIGYLTHSLVKEGYQITGLDISEDAVVNATRMYGNHFICKNIFDYQFESPESFDVIILTEVIEHIRDVYPFIEALIRLLKKKGEIIITTPNKTIFANNSVWDTDLPPVHLWWFSEQSFRTISNRMNVNCNFLDFTYYNKKYFEPYQFAYYKPTPLQSLPRIDREGNANDNKFRMSVFKKIVRIIVRELKKMISFLELVQFIHKFPFLKKTEIYDIKKSSSLCVIFEKK